MSLQQPLNISVILAEAAGSPELEPALEAIERACAGIRAEILVVRPEGRAALPRSTTCALREVIVEEHTLMPERWGFGVRAARAPVFACLTTEFVVHPDWARTLLQALASGAVGAAGAIELAPEAGITATAVYLTRFSAFLPRPRAELSVTDNIPGDTAAYQRAAVMAFPDLLSDGFWEVEFHRRFRAQGSPLLATNKSLSTFHSTRSCRSAVALRYRHGYEYGVTRVVRHHHKVWRLMLAAPLVPAVLLARILRRAASAKGGWKLAIKALPALGLICAGWASGEAAGAWAARGRR